MSLKNEEIKVAIRIRPLLKREKDAQAKVKWATKENSIYQIDETGHIINEPFSFDHIFNSNNSNSIIYNEVVEDFVVSSMNGLNSTIFAYGQTSSGKTYTMLGNDSDPGIMNLSIDKIFTYIKDNNMKRKFLLRVSYIEIYNEKINDLLNPRNKDIKIREFAQGTIGLKDVTEEIVGSKDECLNLITVGNKNRIIAGTAMNERSSRSHTIFKIIIESAEINDFNSKDCALQVSNLNLVDLAGSERVAQTKATGVRLKEGGHINKSLTALSLVIRQLSDGQDFINFRDSKLTRLLQHSLGGNSKTLIIATITLTSAEDTHSTLCFAQRAKAVKNKPQINEILSETAMSKRYAELNSQLRRTLEEQLQKNQHLEKDKEESSKQISRLEKQIRMLQFFQHGSESFTDSSIITPKRRHTIGFGFSQRMKPLLKPINEEMVLDEFNELIDSTIITEEDEEDEEFKPDNLNDIEEDFTEQITNELETPPKVLRNRLNCIEKEYQELVEFTKLEDNIFKTEAEKNAQLEKKLAVYEKDLASSRKLINQLNHELNAIKEQAKSDEEFLIMQLKNKFERREKELEEKIKKLEESLEYNSSNNNNSTNLIHDEEIINPTNTVDILNDLYKLEEILKNCKSAEIFDDTEKNDKILKLESEKHNLEKQIENLNFINSDEINKLKNLLNEQKILTDDYQKKYKDLNESFEKYRNDAQGERDLRKKLELELERIKTELNDKLADEIKSKEILELEIVDLKKNLESHLLLDKKLNDNQKIIEELQKELKNKNDDYENYLKQLEQIKVEKDEALDNLQKNKIEFDNSQKDMKEKINNLNKIIEENQQVLEEEKNCKEKLELEILSLRKVLESHSLLDEKLHDNQKIIENLQQELKQKTDDCENYLKQLVQLEVEKDEVSNKLQKTQIEFDNIEKYMQEKIRNFNKIIEENQQAWEEEKNSKEKLELEIEDLKQNLDSYSSLDGKLNDNQKVINNLREELKQKNEDCENYSKQLEELKLEKDDALSNLQKSQIEFENLKKYMEEKIEIFNKIIEENQRVLEEEKILKEKLELEILNLKNNLESHSVLDEKLNDNQKLIQNLQDELKQKNEACEAYLEQLEQLKLENDEAIKNLQESQKISEEEKNLKKQLEQEVEKLKEELKYYSTINEKTNNNEKIIENLQEELMKKEKQLLSHNNCENNLKIIEQLKIEKELLIDENRNELNRLQKNFESEKSLFDEKINNKNAEIDELKNRLSIQTKSEENLKSIVLTELEEKIENYKNQLLFEKETKEQLEMEMEKLLKKLKEIEIYEKNIENLEKQLAGVEHEKILLEIQLEEKLKHLSDLKSLLKEYESKEDIYNKNLIELREQINILKTEKDEVLQNLHSSTNQEQMIDNLRIEIQTIENQHKQQEDNFKEIIENQKEKIEELNKLLKINESDLKNLKEQLDEKCEQLNNFEINSIKDKEAKILLDKQITNKNKEIDLLNSKINKIEFEKNLHLQTIKDLEEKINKLQNINENSKTNDDIKQKYELEINELKEQLKNRKSSTKIEDNIISDNNRDIFLNILYYFIEEQRTILSQNYSRERREFFKQHGKDTQTQLRECNKKLKQQYLELKKNNLENFNINSDFIIKCCQIMNQVHEDEKNYLNYNLKQLEENNKIYLQEIEKLANETPKIQSVECSTCEENRQLISNLEQKVKSFRKKWLENESNIKLQNEIIELQMQVQKLQDQLDKLSDSNLNKQLTQLKEKYRELNSLYGNLQLQYYNLDKQAKPQKSNDFCKFVQELNDGLTCKVRELEKQLSSMKKSAVNVQNSEIQCQLYPKTDNAEVQCDIWNVAEKNLFDDKYQALKYICNRRGETIDQLQRQLKKQ